MNNIEIANQTIKITEEGKYELLGKTVTLPTLDFSAVEVYSPQTGAELLQWNMTEKSNEKMCEITIVNEDSFQAARKFENPFVMNFANAHNPGGGFKLGANAQEEALCRCSTLYCSLKSEKASEMYKYNNTHVSNVESDYMLLSPNVCVFRDENCSFLENPTLAAVITVPAPNRYGAALFASDKKVAETMCRRIRILLRIAVKNGYKNLVLGAWGCGAFGNNPKSVSRYFKEIIIDEGYGLCFDEICFAVYGKADSKNILEFKRTFDV